MDKHNSIIEIAGGVVAGDFLQSSVTSLLEGLLSKSSWLYYSGLGGFVASAVGGYVTWQGGKHFAAGTGEGIRLAALGSSLRGMSTSLDQVLPPGSREGVSNSRWDFANLAESSSFVGNQRRVWGSIPK